MGFLNLVKCLASSKDYMEAKFQKPSKVVADFSSIQISSKQELLVIMRDNSHIREREKAKIEA